MSRMRTRPTSARLPPALNRSSGLQTCLTATDERPFEIPGGTSGRSRPTAGADVRPNGRRTHAIFGLTSPRATLLLTSAAGYENRRRWMDLLTRLKAQPLPFAAHLGID